MQFFQDILSLTATATTVFEAFDLIDYNDAKIVADDVPVKGFAKHPATAIGMDIAVVAIGTARVRARGAIAKGDRLISAAQGGVKTAPGGAVNVFSRALTAAADGQFVTILIR